MSSQPAELQTLFDEVSHQWYTECKRIEGVQDSNSVPSSYLTSDASHESGSCGHTGIHAGCRQTHECKHAMRLRVR